MTADKIRVKYSQVCSEHVTVIKSSKPTEHLQFTGGHGTQKLPTGKFIICQWKDWWCSVFTDWLFTSEPGSRVSPLRHHQLSPHRHRKGPDKAGAKAPLQDLLQQQPQQSSPEALNYSWCSIPFSASLPRAVLLPRNAGQSHMESKGCQADFHRSCVRIRK